MTALVTGAGGFLGGAIARLLRARGQAVRGFSRGAHAHLAALGVEQVRGDIADATAVRKAAEGCAVVYHVAAKAGVWGGYEAYRRPNVIGTENVIAACRACGVPKLVFTSSPSVTFAGADQDGVDESEPYPATYLAQYSRTKAEAEKRVLAANAANLATVALRPHLIWGPGDTNLVPRILVRARAGTLRLVECGGKKIDSVYIDNAAAAHVLAAERLAPGAACAGKAYFISNGEPMPMAELVNGILAAADLPPVRKSVSPRMAYLAGWAFECWYGLMGRQDEPPLTRFVARQLATAHWFDLRAARRDLGYEPKVTVAEGLGRLKEDLS